MAFSTAQHHYEPINSYPFVRREGSEFTVFQSVKHDGLTKSCRVGDIPFHPPNMWQQSADFISLHTPFFTAQLQNSFECLIIDLTFFSPKCGGPWRIKSQFISLFQKHSAITYLGRLITNNF